VQKWFPEVPSVFFQVIIIKRKSSDPYLTDLGVISSNRI
jgi:hypothetical protein